MWSENLGMYHTNFKVTLYRAGLVSIGIALGLGTMIKNIIVNIIKVRNIKQRLSFG